MPGVNLDSDSTKPIFYLIKDEWESDLSAMYAL